jgi:predicted ATP-dependent protease
VSFHPEDKSRSHNPICVLVVNDPAAGLLARANRGLLYIDEVNLLDDSLVDVVLDSAAGGWNTVEREAGG